MKNFNQILSDLCSATKMKGGRKYKKRRTAKKRRKRRRKTVKKGGINFFRHRKKPDASLFHMEDFKTGEETINPLQAGLRARTYEDAADAYKLSTSQERKKIKKPKTPTKKPRKINFKHLLEDTSRVPELAAPKIKTSLPAPPIGGRKKTRKRN